ncbi:MAG TPA: hypothetical protein VGG19_07185, partial [Tepidisphaeraceae bacterium]
IALVAFHYLPNPNISPNDAPIAKGVMVCPEVGSLLTYNEVTGVQLTIQADGFERRLSYHLQPGLIVDYSYGINGTSYGKTGSNVDPYITPSNYPVVTDLPSSSLAMVYRGSTTDTYYPIRRMGDVKRASETAFFYDGIGWNAYNGGVNSPGSVRVSGSRHGNFDYKRPFTTGLVNVAYFDGHVDSVDRAKITNDTNADFFSASSPRTPPLWRMDQQ